MVEGVSSPEKGGGGGGYPSPFFWVRLPKIYV